MLAVGREGALLSSDRVSSELGRDREVLYALITTADPPKSRAGNGLHRNVPRRFRAQCLPQGGGCEAERRARVKFETQNGRNFSGTRPARNHPSLERQPRLGAACSRDQRTGQGNCHAQVGRGPKQSARSRLPGRSGRWWDLLLLV